MWETVKKCTTLWDYKISSTHFDFYVIEHYLLSISNLKLSDTIHSCLLVTCTLPWKFKWTCCKIGHDTRASEIEIWYVSKFTTLVLSIRNKPSPKSALMAGYIIWPVNVLKTMIPKYLIIHDIGYLAQLPQSLWWCQLT